MTTKLPNRGLSSRGKEPRSWYNFPHYYDLGFRDETRLEADFFEKAFERYESNPIQRLLEPGCGSGRLVVEMAKRGYQVTGLDLNQKALNYGRGRLNRRKLHAELHLADMENFSIDGPFDAAFNTFNTFRHLLTEDAALRHLQCMAKHIRKGGIYILGFHLLPLDCDLSGTERWYAKQGRTHIGYSLTVLESSRRQRLESLRINMNVSKGEERFRITNVFSLRMYTATQFRSLLAKIPSFGLEEVYDFWYEIDEPQVFDNKLVDSVFILKRR